MDVGSQIHASDPLPLQRTPLGVEWKAEWAPDLVWAFWRRKKIPYRKSNLGLPSRYPGHYTEDIIDLRKV